MRKTVTFLLIFAFIALSQQSYSQISKRAGSIFRRNAYLPAFSMNFNLVGFALYGPIIKAEIKLADHVVLAPYFKYSYLGLLSSYEWTNNEDDSKYSPGSLAVGIGPKGFIINRTRKQYIYYGINGEFLHEKGFHNMETIYEYEQTHQAIAIFLSLGYRWNSIRNFYIDLGIGPGIAFDIKNEGIYQIGASAGLPYPGIEEKNRFYGMLDISIGWKVVD